MKLKKIISALAAAVAIIVGSVNPAVAQTDSETIEIPPLFEYPVAPDSIGTLMDRSNWLLEHFWDNFDFNNKKPVGQLQLNHAFEVYSTPMSFASEDAVNASVDRLVKSIRKNPALLYQFSKAAEDCLYSPTAGLWIDNVYLKFIEPVVKEKKIPLSRRKRCEAQLRQIKNTLIGNRLPAFDITLRDNTKTKFTAPAKVTIFEFADPNSVDCMMVRAHLDTNSELKKLQDDGKLQIGFIWLDPDADTDWVKSVKNYSEKWLVAKADGLTEMLDFRYTPSLYLLDANGNIVLKNATLPDVIAAAEALCELTSEIDNREASAP